MTPSDPAHPDRFLPVGFGPGVNQATTSRRGDASDNCELWRVDRGVVETARGRMLPRSETDQMARMFALFGDETRARILCALLHEHELCVCDLSEVLDAPTSTIPRAVGQLRQAGVVSTQQVGERTLFRLHDDHVQILLDVGIAHIRHQHSTSTRSDE